jgi:hypothetical protein
LWLYLLLMLFFCGYWRCCDCCAKKELFLELGMML